MGYYVRTEEVSFDIPDNPEVLDALVALDDRDDLKRGHVWQDGKITESHFSWMNGDWSKNGTVASIFEQLGFEVEEIMDNDIPKVRLIHYDNKIGQEELFLTVVASFVKPGSRIVWRGEDGEMWRNIVGIDGKLYRQEALRSWAQGAEVTL